MELTHIIVRFGNLIPPLTKDMEYKSGHLVYACVH